MEAAHFVYHTFWQENLNEILQPVPDCGDFKYLTEWQIDSLGLTEHFLYPEDVLLVCEEYEIAYRELWLY